MNFATVGYYAVFPPKRMGVSTKTVEVTDSSAFVPLGRRLLVSSASSYGLVSHLKIYEADFKINLSLEG
jgi:hypothetical protein